MRHVLLFDYDGVLVDSLDAICDSFLEACRAHGFTQLRGRQDFLRLLDANLYDGLIAAGLPGAAIVPILKTMDARPAGRHRYTFFPGIPEVLARLAQAHVMFIVTSNHSTIVSEFLCRHGVHCFEEILGGDKERSKAQKIRQVMARYPGHQCYYIGDTKGDMVEGSQAGARTVAVAWGWHPPAHLATAQPTHAVHTPAELLHLFGLETTTAR
jgi:phosphoglycolate phosphatase